MPQKIKDAAGKEIEVFTKEEVDAALADSAKKIGELETTNKQLEADIHPNWKAMREKEKLWEKEKGELHEALKKHGETPGETKPMTPEQVAKMAADSTKRTMREAKEAELLAKFGDKKDVVADYLNRLRGDKELDDASLAKTIEEAARAANVTRSPDANTNANGYGGGSAPNFGDGQQSFADSDAGKATAAAMGLNIAEPKK